MNLQVSAEPAGIGLRQWIKIVVYGLLLVNFVFYVAEDIRVASFTMRNGGSLLKWTEEFATTIDLTAWFLLLFLLELETYVLSDEVLERPWVTRLLHGVRIICMLFLAHSVYAFGNAYLDLAATNAIPGVGDLCQLVGPDISFTRNVEYSDLTAENCGQLASGNEFFYTEDKLVVTDANGFILQRWLELVDWLEVIIWLLILFTIELMVRLQDRGITRGGLVTVVKYSKIGLYACLWGFAAWWLSLGHFHYAWDEALWIIGFFAIEMNMDEWKNEIEAAEAPA